MKESWEYKNLGEVCDVINGLLTGKKEPFVNVTLIRNTNFSKDCKLQLNNVAFIDVEAKQFASRKLKYGDIIMEKSGKSEKQLVGRPILFDLTEGDYSFSNFTSILRIKDIVARRSIRNNDFLQRLILFLADNIGQIFSAKKISDYLKSQKLNMNVGVVQNYLRFIAEAFIINQCRRWDIEEKRFFKIGEKYYYEDLGIRNALIGFRPNDLSGLIENAVFYHLSIQGYKIKTGQNGKGCEIDFIAEKDSEIKYIQVATTIVEDQTREREFGNLMKIKDNYEKIVVTLKDDFPNTYQGIKVFPLLVFLTTFK